MLNWHAGVAGCTLVAVLTLTARATAAAPEATGPTVEVHLTDGSVLKGEITGRSAADITLRTEYGVVRVPAERLSPASRAALFAPHNLADCQSRLGALEARVAALEQENQELRRRLATQQEAATTLLSRPAPGAAAARTSADASLRYSMSSTGKRHSSRCRYYEPAKPCSPTAGVACKICGG